MILKELCEYYDILSKDNPNIPPIGYSIAKVGYAIVLTEQGEISSILDLRETVQKKLVGRNIIVPEQAGRTSGVFAYFLCDKAEYVFGLGDKNLKKFTEFKKYHLENLGALDNPSARAICNFYNKYKTEDAEKIINEYISKFDNNLLFVFMLNNSNKYIHEDAEIKQVWATNQATWYECFDAACLISGEESQAARKHPAIRNFGSQGQVYIVSFNADAFKSYGKDMNAPVSLENAFKYTTITSYLLRKDSNQKTFLGDSTIVFWAQHPSPKYNETFLAFINPSVKLDSNKNDDEKEQDTKKEKLINDVLSKIKAGIKPSVDDEELNTETKFCVLALAPSNSRLSVRFFHQDSFGDLIKKVGQHYEDMEIVDARVEQIPVWLLAKETVHEKGKPSPLLAGRILASILAGSAYPSSLLESIIKRVYAEREINATKAGIIKACLIRKYKNKREELTVSLNENLKEPAYMLGRLFAVLEQAQWKALGDVNSGIRERFFASAASSPARVFPLLLKNTQNHLGKMAQGSSIWFDKQIGEIMADIACFPPQFNMDEQGIFMLGYYHQRQALFAKKETQEV